MTVASLSLIPAGSATAADECEESADRGENGGKVCWIDDGDDFRVCDIDKGHSGHAWAAMYRARADGTWNRVDKEEDGGDWGCDTGGKDTNIPNGVKVKLKICVQYTSAGPLYGCQSFTVRE